MQPVAIDCFISKNDDILRDALQASTSSFPLELRPDVMHVRVYVLLAEGRAQ